MKESRFSDNQIIAVLMQTQAGTPVLELCPRARHQLGDVLQVAQHVWRHGRLADVPAQGAAGREPAAEEDVRRRPAQLRPAEEGHVKKIVRPSQRREMVLCTVQGGTTRHPHRAHQPGKPQQNAYVERYNRAVCYAWLARIVFDSIERVQDKATRWLWTYNHERPNMTLGGITPMQKPALAA